MAFHGTVTGNLGDDPTLRFTKDGKATLNLSIAATPSRQDQQTRQWQDVGEPVWIRATLWEHMAERLADALHKGDRVSVEGTLSIRTYQAQDGSQRLSYELLGAKFLGVVPRAPQNGAQPFPGAANSPSDGYTPTQPVGGPQNGTQDPWGGPSDVAPF